MIGPDMTREFCGPCYRRWVAEGKAVGTTLFAIDSDGRNDELIPVWLECGINCIDPLEVAAGNDINALRETYGDRLAFRGGIDKRAIAAGGDALKKEVDRVRPVRRKTAATSPAATTAFPRTCRGGTSRDYAVPARRNDRLAVAPLRGFEAVLPKTLHARGLTVFVPRQSALQAPLNEPRTGFAGGVSVGEQALAVFIGIDGIQSVAVQVGVVDDGGHDAREDDGGRQAQQKKGPRRR